MIDDDARRIARELISAAVVGEIPVPTMMAFAPDEDARAVVIALSLHARGLVRVTAKALDITTAEVLDMMALMDARNTD